MDYDLSRVNYAPEWEGGTPCGTIHYMAPEIVQHQRYSLAVDMWSLGVILFILLTGRMPFDGKDRESIVQAIEAGQYCMDPKLWCGVSEKARDLVCSLLQHNPQQRPTAHQVLEHPWLMAELHPTRSAELDSPVQLRSTLSKTERGRQLLALAALAYSESDVCKPHSAAGGSGAPRLPKQRRGHASAAAEVLDFDMQAVRDQAGGGSGGTALTSTVEAAGEEKSLGRLRYQLQIIGTVAGLQDRELLGGSPRSPGLAGEASPTRARPAQQQQPKQRQLLTIDSFEALEAQEVEEHDLSSSGSEADAGSGAGRSRHGSRRGSRCSGITAEAGCQQQQELLAPLQLRLPPEHQLPADKQLLEQLAQGGRGAAVAGVPPWVATPGVRQQGPKRVQSAYAASRDDGGLHRSTSTSQLDSKDARFPTSRREPVERAMQQKQRRLAHIRTASASGQEWQQMGVALLPRTPAL